MPLIDFSEFSDEKYTLILLPLILAHIRVQLCSGYLNSCNLL